MNYPTLEDVVGNTPLVRLKRITAGKNNTLLAKLEGNNPAGSVKDRPALSMLSEAEARGEISPGDTLIEATSGNTGIALAMAAALKGYNMTLIMPENASAERKQAMAALPRHAADTVVTEYGVAELGGLSLHERARAMIRIAAPQFRDELERAWSEMRDGL